MAVIVTAEDDDDIRMVTARCLQRAGHTVRTCPARSARLRLATGT